MEQQTVNTTKLVRTLSKLSESELEFISKTLSRHNKQKVSIKEAAEFSKLNPGFEVKFTDYKGVNRTGVIKKVNSKFVKIHEKTSNSYFAVKPYAISEVLGKAETEKAPRKARKPRTPKVEKTEKVRKPRTPRAAKTTDVKPQVH